MSVTGNNSVGLGYSSTVSANNLFFTDLNFETSGNATFGGKVKFNTQSGGSGTAGEIAHHTNNYLYIRGGTAGLAIGDDGLDRSIYFPNSGTIGVYGAIDFDSNATFAGDVTVGNDLIMDAAQGTGRLIIEPTSGTNDFEAIRLKNDTHQVYLSVYRGGTERGRIATAHSDLTLHATNSGGVRVTDDSWNGMRIADGGDATFGGTLTVNDTASIKNTVKISDAQVSSNKVISPITNSGYTTVKQLDGGYQSGIIILSIYQTNNSAAVRTQIYGFNANYYHRTVSEISDVAGAGSAPKANVRIVRSDNSTSSDGAEPYYVQVQAGNSTSIGARVLVLSAR